ncbi:MAG: SDR family oxidoreductase [Acidobacteriota bacterium]|nr:SDR family oxidoreductase [Acidobacteriota bacterium]
MPKALITGASGGIGLELARVFAREGYALVLVARSEKRLQELAAELKTETVVIANDLTRPGAAQEVFEQVRQVDVLVNNAGFGSSGKFVEAPLDEQLGMMQLNMTALVALTGLFLPAMVKAKSGRIMNVASTAAFQPGPLMATYYATKAFVLSFSEAIHEELSGSGVTVTALCPGATETGFVERANMNDARLFKAKKPMAARAVAEAGYRGMLAGKAIVIPGLMNSLMAQSVRVSPRSVVRKIARHLNDRVK